MLLAYADLIITFNCIYTWLDSSNFLIGLSSTGFLIFLLFQTTVFLAFISHLRCSFADPGKTPKLDCIEVDGENIRYCDFCDQIKPPRTHHCTRCNKCIHRMDHHCIWVNNCIGLKNHKYFLLFLFYISLGSGFGFFIILYCGYFLLSNQSDFINWKVFLVCIAAGECLLFGIFTADFLKEQINTVRKNQTNIEKLLRKYGENFGSLDNLKIVMGANILFWALPLSPNTKFNYLEPLYSFSEMIMKKKRKKSAVEPIEFNLIE